MEFFEKFKQQQQEVRQNILYRVQVSKGLLDQLDRGNKAALTELTRNELKKLGLYEHELVFRALAHPAKNITEQLLVKYGTDRFREYSSGNLPKKDKNLIPYRNQGETALLTADTYSVPNLEWALTFTELTLPDGIQKFQNNQLAPFLIMYKNSHVHTDRTPGNKSGEQWRTTFLTDQKQALAAIIHFNPPLHK